MGGNFPGGNFVGGNFPGGSLIGGNFPGGAFLYIQMKQLYINVLIFW